MVPGVTVEYIGGRAPVLYSYDVDGNQLEEIPVHEYTFEQLEALVRSEGSSLARY